MRRAAEAGYPTATDLADWMVRTLDMPFREAHKKAARAVAKAEGKGVALDALPLGDMKKIEPKLSKDVYKVLSLEASVRARAKRGRHRADARRRADRLLEGQAEGTTR